MLQKKNFHKNKAQNRGYAHYCKECMKSYLKIPAIDEKRRASKAAYGIRPEVKERNKTRFEKYQSKPGYRERHNERSAAQRNDPKNKIKISARAKANRAIKSGKLTRLPCEVCNIEPAEAHHDDYTKPLEIKWLCSSHHKQHHGIEKRSDG